MRGFPAHCRSPIDLALMYRKKDLYRLILRFEAEKTQEATRNLMFELESIEEVRAATKAQKKNKKKITDDAPASIGDDFLDLQVLTASDKMPPLVGDCDGGAPSEFVCPIELRLMVDDPVLASDGFMYSRAGLEAWISRCEANGLPLISPLTGEVMGAAFHENKTHRNMVRRWVEQRSLGEQ
jgi:hypothetical protein